MTDWSIAESDMGPTGSASRDEPQELFWRPTREVERSGIIEALQSREQITLQNIGSADISAYPGTRITALTLKHQRMVRRLRRLIKKFATEGFGWSADSICKITPETAAAAKRLLDLMPPVDRYPKIAPDGDGGLTTVWKRKGYHDLLVIDGWMIHIVRNAATDRARYYDDVPFDGRSLPEPAKSLISA